MLRQLVRTPLLPHLALRFLGPTPFFHRLIHISKTPITPSTSSLVNQLSKIHTSSGSKIHTSKAVKKAAEIPPEIQHKLKNDPILKRIPKFLHRYTTRFMNAPVSHVVSFLILHELTAIVPLLSLWYLFHQFPDMLPSFDLPTWAIDKGTKIIDDAMNKYDFADYSINEKFQFIMEGAYAFVVVKFLLPIRLVVSLGLMPSFARWFVIPFTKIFKRKTPAKKTPIVSEGATAKKISKPRL